MAGPSCRRRSRGRPLGSAAIIGEAHNLPLLLQCGPYPLLQLLLPPAPHHFAKDLAVVLVLRQLHARDEPVRLGKLVDAARHLGTHATVAQPVDEAIKGRGRRCHAAHTPANVTTLLRGGLQRCRVPFLPAAAGQGRDENATQHESYSATTWCLGSIHPAVTLSDGGTVSNADQKRGSRSLFGATVRQVAGQRQSGFEECGRRR